jgi:hypothetical protein
LICGSLPLRTWRQTTPQSADDAIPQAIQPNGWSRSNASPRHLPRRRLRLCASRRRWHGAPSAVRGDQGMDQGWLLPKDVSAQTRWRPVVPPFRPRQLAKSVRVTLLPGQLLLFDMDSDEADAHGKANGQLTRPVAGPTCPNCGGREFDEDGDCTTCWEPGVIPPVSGNSNTERVVPRSRWQSPRKVR